MALPDYIDARELATLAGGCSIATIHRLVREHKLPAPTVVGRSHVWPRAEMADWLRKVGDYYGAQAALVDGLQRVRQDPSTTPAGRRAIDAVLADVR